MQFGGHILSSDLKYAGVANAQDCRSSFLGQEVRRISMPAHFRVPIFIIVKKTVVGFEA